MGSLLPAAVLSPLRRLEHGWDGVDAASCDLIVTTAITMM